MLSIVDIKYNIKYKYYIINILRQYQTESQLESARTYGDRNIFILKLYYYFIFPLNRL